MTTSLVGHTIGVLGLARSGLAAAKLALARGARVYASDASDTPQTRRAAEQINALHGLAEVGRHDLGKLARCQKIVLSPGIPPGAAVLRAPEIAHVPVIPEIEFAFGLLECPVIAITGTNGKTTVTSLIGHLLREHGEDAAVGGNIGTALSELVMREPQPRIAVVETSSFQLGGIREFNPRIGVLTNLAPDHLDWYTSLDSYYADKAHLFRNATGESRWILNGEDEKARELPGKAPGTRYYFRVQSQPAAGELGGFVSPDGWLVLRMEPGKRRARSPRRATAHPGAAQRRQRAGRLHRRAAGRGLGPVDRPGPEDLRRAAAPAAARGRGRRRAVDQRQQGHQHRLHPGGGAQHDPAHRPPAGRAATRASPTPSCSPSWAAAACAPSWPMARRGRSSSATWRGRRPWSACAGGFDDVVRRAREIARPGDAVLLSPACSSFDQFANYEERGRRFAQLVAGGAGVEPAVAEALA